MRPTKFIALAALAAASSSALAFVPWSNPAGNGSFFSWANGGSTNGLFGSPILIGGDSFTFFPQAFRAQSVNGAAVSVNDRLSFDILVQPGYQVTGVRIAEQGDYGVLFTGSVSVIGILGLENLDTAQTVTDNLVVSPTLPITSGNGRWDGVAQANAPASPPWTRVRVTLDNTLSATSAPGSVAFIEKKVVGAGVSVQIVPAPAAVAVLGLAGLAGMSRRRRAANAR
jgi:uncharacterized protein (TIGR03382 family)